MFSPKNDEYSSVSLSSAVVLTVLRNLPGDGANTRSSSSSVSVLLLLMDGLVVGGLVVVVGLLVTGVVATTGDRVGGRSVTVSGSTKVICSRS